jgi:hypothetical protein
LDVYLVIPAKIDQVRRDINRIDALSASSTGNFVLFGCGRSLVLEDGEGKAFNRGNTRVVDVLLAKRSAQGNK